MTTNTNSTSALGYEHSGDHTGKARIEFFQPKTENPDGKKSWTDKKCRLSLFFKTLIIIAKI